MKSRDNRRKSDLAVIQQALEMFYSDNHFFPSVGLKPGDVCVKTPRLSTPLTKYLSPIPADPKGDINYCYNYVLDSEGLQHYIIFSTLEVKNPNDKDYNKTLPLWCDASKCGKGYINGDYHYYVSSD